MSLKDPQAKREYQHRWYMENRERIQAVNQKWKDSHKEERAEYLKEYHEKNSERISEYQKSWRKKNKKKLREQGREWRYKTQYGISVDEYDNLLIGQSGLCAICSVQMVAYHEPCVDHCHKTGRVRGLLCRKCNAMIGFCDDSTKVLESAIIYLEK